MSWCWIKGHKWKIISFFDYIDISYDYREPSHALTLQCEKCGNIKTIHNTGAGPFKELID